MVAVGSYRSGIRRGIGLCLSCGRAASRARKGNTYPFEERVPLEVVPGRCFGRRALSVARYPALHLRELDLSIIQCSLVFHSCPIVIHPHRPGLRYPAPTHPALPPFQTSRVQRLAQNGAGPRPFDCSIHGLIRMGTACSFDFCFPSTAGWRWCTDLHMSM